MIPWKVFDMTRDDSHGEDTPQAGPAVVPSTMVATPRAVPVALGPLEVPPPVESQHHRRRRLVIVSQRDGGSDTETLRMSESGEVETASGDGLSVDEGVSRNQQCSRIQWMWRPETRCSNQNFGDMVPRRDLPTSGMRDAVSAFHHESCVQRCHEGCTPGSDERGRELNCGSRVSRVWKLFLLLPRLLLFRSPRGGRVPKKELEDRLCLFHSGQWSELWASSMSNEAEAPNLIPTSTPRSM